MTARVSSEDVLACRRAVRESLADLGSGSRALVACSGGPDSLALVGAAAHEAPRMGVAVAALVVDHGLQEGSAAVSADAARTCELLGVAASVVRVEVGSSGGPEAAAREARYAALSAAAQTDSVDAVLLGHTLEDQAETVLLRLARGSGARSLAGMRERSGLWRRPFLHLSRTVVRAAAEEMLEPLGRAPWRDPHNADPSFARVRVRNLLDDLREALGEGAILGLARTADLLRDDADALDALAGESAAVLVDVQGREWSADCDALATLPAALRTRVIRSMIVAAGCPADDAGVEHVRTIDALITDWHGQGEARLPGAVRVERLCGRLCVHGGSPDWRIGGA